MNMIIHMQEGWGGGTPKREPEMPRQYAEMPGWTPVFVIGNHAAVGYTNDQTGEYRHFGDGGGGC